MKYHEASSGKPLPYSKDLNDELAPLIEGARAARTIAHEAMTALQEHRRTLRSLAMDLNQELIAFRRALRPVIGTTHRDYHMLRVSRGRHDGSDAEDEIGSALETDEAPLVPPGTVANDTEENAA